MFVVSAMLSPQFFFFQKHLGEILGLFYPKFQWVKMVNIYLQFISFSDTDMTH